MQMGSMQRIRRSCHALPCCLLLLDHLQVTGQYAYNFSLLHPPPQLQFTTNKFHVYSISSSERSMHIGST